MERRRKSGSRYEVLAGKVVLHKGATLLPTVQWARSSTRARRALRAGETLSVVRVEVSVVQEITAP